MVFGFNESFHKLQERMGTLTSFSNSVTTGPNEKDQDEMRTLQVNDGLELHIFLV